MRFREFRRDETFYALFLLPRAKRRPGKTRDRSLLFTTLYSPRFLGPRFYEKSSVLIFGRVVAFSCRNFLSNYVDTMLNFPLFLNYRIVNRVDTLDIIYFSELLG